uniref:hypothetical protein n=1 Tax=Acetatifactor sp. TaxID=1872090 RepID=UPI004056137B
MLGKLIKHEWKSVSKVGCIILISALVVGIIGSIFMSNDAVVRLFSGEVNEDSFQVFVAVMMLVVSFGAYLLLLVGGMYGIMIYLGVHFYRSMYTSRGYLVHTLPVTPHQILLSKIIVSGIWMFLVNLVLIIGAVAMVGAFIFSIARGEEPGITFGEFLSTFGRIFEEMGAVSEEVRSFFRMYIMIIVFSLLITPFSNMTMLFGGLTLGQLSKKYKLLMSILSYIGILIVNYIIGTFASIVTAMITTEQMSVQGMPTDSMGVTYGITFGMTILISVILYFVSHFILSKKLNMD